MVMMGNKMESVFDGKENIYTNAEKGNEDKKLLHIVNNTPLELVSTVKKSLTTTTELAMQVNEVFKPLFSDWHGCEIVPDNNGNLLVNFIFKAINTGKEDTRAFLPINHIQEKSSNKTLDRINAINLMNSSKNRTMELTSYGAEMIYDVMVNSLKKSVNPANIPSMYKIIGEVAENVGYGGMVQNIYCTATGIDIFKVLGVVFGTKDKDNGSRIVYNARAIRPVAANVAGVRANYIVEIERMTMDDYNAAMMKMGMFPMPGAITAVTGTISEMKK